MTIVPDFQRLPAEPVRPLPRPIARPVARPLDRSAPWPAAAPVPRAGTRAASRRAQGIGGSALFWAVKGMADLLGALLLLPLVGVMACLLLLLNPVFNPGPVFFRQRRMGMGQVPFTALKFRTMRPGPGPRGPSDPLEVHRITPLGGVLRRMGLDEVPQAINILRREMSLIGPRPDCLPHAEVFLAEIPEYRHRFRVRPGLSGLAQVRHGYAVGTEATRAKARSDMDYIARAGFALDAHVVWRTLLAVLRGAGD